MKEEEKQITAVELDIEAKTERLPELLSLIEEQLEGSDCPMKARMQIAVAAEEIFVNIASYAYAPDTGRARIRLEVSGEEKCLTLTFADSGRPFDPTEKSDPDLSLSAEERSVGGLGIYMTKKLMDKVTYAFRDGMNVLTLQKSW